MEYKAWKDNGNNIGIQCLVCGRTRWNESDPTTIPNSNPPQECTNCEALHTAGTIATEVSAHQNEITNHLNCVHQSTQPAQQTPVI